MSHDERQRLHQLLQDFWSLTNPDEFPELCEAAYQELKDCHGETCCEPSQPVMERRRTYDLARMPGGPR